MIKQKIKRFMNARVLAQHGPGAFIQPSVGENVLRSFAADIRANVVSVPLIRIGGEGDGGYLLPDDFDGIEYCFSPGVSTTADFEEYIARNFGIKSFMADASVEKSPLENSLFDFDKKFLGARCDDTFTTLGAWVEDKLGDDDDHDLLLQMDIESGEFDVLIESDSTLLRRFRMMVIEFHGMQRVFERHSLPLLRALFAKLHKDFAIVHMHANNCCGIAEIHGVGIPRVFEITYLRRDRVAKLSTDMPVKLPHSLDRPNVASRADIVMPEMWWRE